jgi:fucose permease
MVRMMRRSFEVLSLASFVGLGVPDGMIGTAWPSMRQSLGAPIGDLGLILIVATVGSAVVSACVGALIRRLGVPALLAVSGCCSAVAAAGFALAPGLWLVIGVAVLAGAGAGLLDSGLNTAVGLSGRQRLLNLLHGCYGIGAAAGPLVVTAAILTGSWRRAYVALLVADLALAGSWLLHRLRDPSRPEPVSETATAVQAHSGPRWPRRSVLVAAAGIGVFFIYTGLEVGAGQWEASFCRGHLGLTAFETGLASFGYWGALAAVRFSLALPRHPLPPRAVVRWGSGLAVIAAAVIWAQPGAAATVAAFVVLGGALAGLFPALVALTPGRVGQRQAQQVIGWQMGGAAVGGAGLSAVIGWLITAAGLGVLGPSITVLALLLVAAELMLGRLAATTPRQLPGS